MRCKACDHDLNDRESTRKGVATGEYLDLCDPCYGTIADQIEVVENPKHQKDQPEVPPELMDD